MRHLFFVLLMMLTQPQASHAASAIADASASAKTPTTVATKSTTDTPASPAPNSNGLLTTAPQYASTGEVLQVAKLALDDAHKHTEHAVDMLKIYGGIGAGLFATIGGLFGFLGYREVKSLTKPVRDKLDKHTSDLDQARIAFEAAKDEHMASINEDIQAMKRAHQEEMKKLTTEFIKKSELNSKAQVIAATIWEYVGKDATNNEELAEAVRLVRSVIKDDTPSTLDPFLEGVLLIRMAFAQKRLGDPKGAFISAKRAVQLNDNDVKHFWLFNTACYAALAGELEECKHYTILAVTKDPAASKKKLASDPDLKAVHEEEWFKHLLA